MRTERLNFNIAVTGDEYGDAKDLVDIVLGRNYEMKVLETDLINVNYEIEIDYIGDIALRLMAIIQMREMGIPVHINMKELTDGRCLFAEIIQHMDTILEKA